ncbi:MAG: hypothetical protein Q7J35_18350 [Candidatus Methanoperedens sp.]|nr:hypothetical protein [Candidatus Methanoperedens sp.]
MSTEQEQEQTFKEQFIYPKNLLLRRSLQGIIYTVLKLRRVVFRPEVLSLAILNYHGWVDDSNFDTDKPPGSNYKKAVNILKTFERKFTKFAGSGLGLEIFIFRLDGVRVKSFEELEYLCSLDLYMNEIVATTAELDMSQKWEDIYVTETPITNSVVEVAEIVKMDTAKPFNKDPINNIIAAKPNSFGSKHKHIIKGSDLSPEDLDEIKASVNELIGGHSEV